jgi:hypothetical protein
MVILPKGIQYEIPQGYKLVGKLLFPEKIDALQTVARINPSEYSLMQEGDSANSAISMVQGFNGKNYLNAHKEVLKDGLVVPTPARFMPHLRNVNEALNERTVLYDASGKLIEGDRLSQYGQRLNRNCWAWLNAGFENGSGFRNLDLVTITGLDKNGNIVSSRAPLEDCLAQDGWADITSESLNKQGFPTKKSPIGDKYEAGKTAYFWYPRNGAVTRFLACSDWANLNCDRIPSYSDDGLGVFSSAEGANVAKKDNGAIA